ncbi:hypothetical protein M413DRAFT_447125 [Hebeloma cylindrosporum]|uniref:Uncharacterized protein n=1 Tax=Hebeloma cylindrosporum TaxID=76867 RepID=A0A0C3C7X7_HEBCY|nr:hypothetical protein M413DRAFT_447125 [Hebeloma cylindrosporum h7]
MWAGLLYPIPPFPLLTTSPRFNPDFIPPAKWENGHRNPRPAGRLEIPWFHVTAYILGHVPNSAGEICLTGP